MKGAVNIKLAQRLRELRQHSKMSQRQLADAVGVTKQAVSKYEAGAMHIPIDRAEDMMRVMGFEARHLHEEPGSALPPVSFRPRREDPALMPDRSRALTTWTETAPAAPASGATPVAVCRLVLWPLSGFVPSLRFLPAAGPRQ